MDQAHEEEGGSLRQCRPPPKTGRVPGTWKILTIVKNDSATVAALFGVTVRTTTPLFGATRVYNETSNIFVEFCVPTLRHEKKRRAACTL